MKNSISTKNLKECLLLTISRVKRSSREKMESWTGGSWQKIKKENLWKQKKWEISLMRFERGKSKKKWKISKMCILNNYIWKTTSRKFSIMMIMWSRRLLSEMLLRLLTFQVVMKIMKLKVQKMISFHIVPKHQ